MFILREITTENFETNTCLGEAYTICNREYFPSDDEKYNWDKVFSVIIANEREYPLRKDRAYFVMSPNGSTFQRISKNY